MKSRFTQAAGLVAFAVVVGYITSVIADCTMSSQSVALRGARVVVPDYPGLDVEVTLAAGKVPSVFVSELDTDIHASRYAAARRAATDARFDDMETRSELAQLRAALYAWDKAVHDAAAFQARGGTLYSHLAARAAAETEDFLFAITDDFLPAHTAPTGTATRHAATDAMLRRIEGLRLIDYGVADSEAYLEERRSELAHHKDKLQSAWLQIDHCLCCLPLPLAARIAARSIEVFNIID